MPCANSEDPDKCAHPCRASETELSMTKKNGLQAEARKNIRTIGWAKASYLELLMIK